MPLFRVILEAAFAAGMSMKTNTTVMIRQTRREIRFIIYSSRFRCQKLDNRIIRSFPGISISSCRQISKRRRSELERRLRFCLQSEALKESRAGQSEAGRGSMYKKKKGPSFQKQKDVII